MARPRGKTKDRNTAVRILTAAEALFAEKGFYGTSLRDIGQAVGIRNPSLLHHFPSKGALYGAVLERIGATLDALVAEVAVLECDEAARFEALFAAIWHWHIAHHDYARIVMRELMDNVGRAEHVRRWYLAQPITAMAEMVRRGQAGGALRPGDPDLVVTHLIGTIAYFFTALPTYAGVTRRKPLQMTTAYHDQAWAQLSRALIATPQPSTD